MKIFSPAFQASLGLALTIILTSLSHAELDAHIHGLSNLTLAMENNILEIKFSSPTMNLVGFEQKATTKKEIEAIEKAKNTLKKHRSLYTFIGTQCSHKPHSADIISLPDNQSNFKEDSHVHHHEEAGHQEGKSDNHSEIIANYRFYCKDITRLTSINISLLKYFPGIHKLNAIWVAEHNQGSANVSKSNPIIHFR